MATFGRRSSMRWMLIAPLVLVAVVATVAVALADQVDGAHYTGLLKPADGTFRPTISFAVSANGTHVRKLEVDHPPSYCGYGGPGETQKKAKPVAIASDGSFSETLEFVYNGAPRATLEITGQFHANGNESGKATVTWPGSPDCNGKVGYSAKPQ